MAHKIANHYEKIKNTYPEYLEDVENLGLTAKKAGPIDEKNAQLIQLAASVAIRSEGATHSHTKRALEAGANSEEIRHCIIMLTNTIGFPVVMAGLSWVNDILD